MIFLMWYNIQSKNRNHKEKFFITPILLENPLPPYVSFSKISSKHIKLFSSDRLYLLRAGKILYIHVLLSCAAGRKEKKKRAHWDVSGSPEVFCISLVSGIIRRQWSQLHCSEGIGTNDQPWWSGWHFTPSDHRNSDCEERKNKRGCQQSEIP